MALKAAKLKVTGRVQQVGYRRYVLELAQEEEVAGFVKNEKDGSVTVFAQGQQSKVGSFLKKVRSPPPPAVVKMADEISAKPNTKFKHFSVIFGNIANELQEGFGAMQSEFRDYREEFRDYRSEFKDYREEFKDYRSEFRGFAKRTDENFKSLDAKYGAISEKLGEILAALTEQAKKTQEMLESMRSEAKQTAETLNESLRLLRDAVEKLPRAS